MWVKAHSQRLIQKMLSNGQLLIVVRRQINFGNDQNAASIDRVVTSTLPGSVACNCQLKKKNILHIYVGIHLHFQQSEFFFFFTLT